MVASMSDKYYTLMLKGTVATKTPIRATLTKVIGPRVSPTAKANNITKVEIRTTDKSCMEKSLALESTDLLMGEFIRGVFTTTKVMGEVKSATRITAFTKVNGN